jgi:hypothetical protein
MVVMHTYLYIYIYIIDELRLHLCGVGIGMSSPPTRGREGRGQNLQAAKNISAYGVQYINTTWGLIS